MKEILNNNSLNNITHGKAQLWKQYNLSQGKAANLIYEHLHQIGGDWKVKDHTQTPNFAYEKKSKKKIV